MQLGRSHTATTALASGAEVSGFEDGGYMGIWQLRLEVYA